MTYDERLADRVRRAVGPRPDVTEKKMFGGVAFLLDGKMFCGVANDDLMVRVGPDRHEAALAEPNVRPMDFTGRPMKGYVFVSKGGCRTDRAVGRWVDLGLAFVATVDGGRKRRRAPTDRASAGRARPDTAPKAGATTRYALLLRGVNVGTKNSLPMAELRSVLTKMGCSDVETYLQSGNAVLSTKLSPAALTKAIERALEVTMGRPIATTLRTLCEMNRIVEAKPFGKTASNPRHLCVTFLSSEPTKAELAALSEGDWAPELFAAAGRELYTWHPNGQGRSPLATALAKLRVRGTVTTRNWNTVIELRAMLAGS